MFCYQCQETVKNEACTRVGVCGKDAVTAGLQDLLLYFLKGLSWWSLRLPQDSPEAAMSARFTLAALFNTITNANFDQHRFIALIEEGLELRERCAALVRPDLPAEDATALPPAAVWQGRGREELLRRAEKVSIADDRDEEIRARQELVIYGLKGVAAYAEHAAVLGRRDPEIHTFVFRALAATLDDLSVAEWTALVLETGKTAVKAMSLLDQANTETYGQPELTKVSLSAGNRPGILISGHDLHDLAQLLEQSSGQGVDVYTHSEMLPAHAYPAFRKYDHFAGNYGGSWWRQGSEFASFNGPILMTTNCIIPVRDAYRGRIFTSGQAGYPGVKHIRADAAGRKDFSEIIALAKTCPPPVSLEEGQVSAGFAHQQFEQLAPNIVAAIKAGKIGRFVVMAGCDGRQAGRDYYSDLASNLPDDAVILTAGCAKYRYNKLDLGEIEGLPRVLDAGQCNDSYSLALIALRLKELLGAADVNDLPLYFVLAWYEQKALAVLLALLYLGFRDLRVGPTLPAFLSPGLAEILVESFGIRPLSSWPEDLAWIKGSKKS